MPHRPNLLVTGDFDIPPAIAAALAPHFAMRQLRRVPDLDMLAAALADASFYVLGGPEYADAALLDAAGRLRGLVVMGTGTPSFVDIDAARARGIAVRNTPHLNTDAVVEFAAAMMVAVDASVFGSWDGVREGSAWEQSLRRGLDACTIGIVGAGPIGCRLMARLRTLAPRSRLLYWSRSAKPEAEAATGARWTDLDTLFGEADLCSVQIAYHPRETHHLIGERLLRRGRGTLRLLHFCNPKVVDPAALRDALEAGHVAHAFMDGYYREWRANGGAGHDPEALLAMGAHRFVATSHIAALSGGAVAAILAAAATHLLDWVGEGDKS